jgi:hypothetical protein
MNQWISGISEPELGEVQGPLASANTARCPWLIFFQRHDWLQRLNKKFDVVTLSKRPIPHGYRGNLAQAADPIFSLSQVIFHRPGHQTPLSGLLRSFFYRSPDETVISTGITK